MASESNLADVLIADDGLAMPARALLSEAVGELIVVPAAGGPSPSRALTPGPAEPRRPAAQARTGPG